jgi:hypothetical protein
MTDMVAPDRQRPTIIFRTMKIRRFPLEEDPRLGRARDDIATTLPRNVPERSSSQNRQAAP